MPQCCGLSIVRKDVVAGQRDPHVPALSASRATATAGMVGAVYCSTNTSGGVCAQSGASGGVLLYPRTRILWLTHVNIWVRLLLRTLLTRGSSRHRASSEPEPSRQYLSHPLLTLLFLPAVGLHRLWD